MSMSRILAALALSALLPAAARADAGSDALEALRDALRADLPEDRCEGIDRFARRVVDLSPAQAQRAAVILRKSFEEEGGAGPRGAIVRALARIPLPAAWVPVILASFGDRDESVRREARRAVLSARSGFLAVVERLLTEDEDPTFRANLLLVLRDRRRADAVPLLLAALEDHPRVAAAAAEALEAITGETFGLDADAWKRWAQERPAPPPPASDGETVTVAPDGEVGEPPPFTPRSLVPDFYGLPLREKDIVFVVDVSGSVGGSGVERAKRELEAAVERLGSDVRIAAVFFDEEVRLWKNEMVLASPANKADLARFMRSVRPGRRTDLMTPIHAGLQFVRRRVEEKQAAAEPFLEAVAMVLLSDGQETSARTPPGVVEEKLDRLDLTHSVVHAVVLGGEDSLTMRALAIRGGGRYLVVPR
jgi:hypothetical protein